MTPNWIDLIIVGVTAYYVYQGFTKGFAAIAAEFCAFLLSFYLAVRFHAPVGTFFAEKFGIGAGWTDLVGYIAVAFLSEAILVELFSALLSRIPKKMLDSKSNAVLGSFAAAANALIILSFVIIHILSLPLRGSIKTDIGSSSLARFLVTVSERYGGEVKSSLENAAKRAVSFLTVEPGSNERLPLDVPDTGMTLSVSAAEETRMVGLFNRERAKQGLPALTADPKITDVARGKSRDMFERRYFSHNDPDGRNAADRMETAGVPFRLVGENLAYAPDLATAHEGLMNSEGHRANILEKKFTRIGIGIIDSKYYGMMFTQIFAD